MSGTGETRTAELGRLLGEETPDLANALIALERTNPDTVITFNRPGNLQQLVTAAHASGWCTEVNTDRLKIWPSMRP